MTSPLRPIELRHLLEGEVRAAVDAARLARQPIEPMLIVAGVLERHQHRSDVKPRLELLWSHLEAYVAFLVGLDDNR